MRGKPPLDGRVLVGAVVVTDQVDVEFGRDVVVELGQELLEFDGSVSAVEGAVITPVATFNAANRVVIPCRT